MKFFHVLAGVHAQVIGQIENFSRRLLKSLLNKLSQGEHSFSGGRKKIEIKNVGQKLRVKQHLHAHHVGNTCPLVAVTQCFQAWQD